MRLPSMVYADGIGKAVQTAFGGYNHTRQARDGELYDMRNLTGDFPGLLATRGGGGWWRPSASRGAWGA